MDLYRLFGKILAKYFSEIFTSFLLCISAILSIIVFWKGIQNDIYGNYKIFEWISSGKFVANWSINIDPLSSIMLGSCNFCFCISSYLLNWLYESRSS